MVLVLPGRPTISAGDTDTVAVDGRPRVKPYLDDGELFTGTPTIVEVTTSDLTLSNKAVSTTALTIKDRTVAIGEAIQFSVSGQQASTTYTVQITCATDATPARTKVFQVQFDVED